MRFDQTGKAEVFLSSITPQLARITVGSVALVTVSNLFFLAMEAKQQYFGTLSLISSGVLGALGVAFISAYFVLAPRTIRQVRLLSNMKELEVTFFGALGRGRSQVVEISDLSGLRPASFGFHVADSHTRGKLWVPLWSNERRVYPGLEDITRHLLNGNYLGADEVERKALKFKPR